MSPAPVSAAPEAPVQAVTQAASTEKKTSKPAFANPEYEPDYEDIELSNMRRVIAKRLVLSKTTIPHSYISTTATMDKVMDLRKKMIASGNKVSLNDFVIKAAALALKVSVQLKFVYIDASQFNKEKISFGKKIKFDFFQWRDTK